MSNRRHAQSAPPAHRMKALAGAAGLGFAPLHEPSVWLREAISDLRARIMAASFRVCPHLRPDMVVVTALWAWLFPELRHARTFAVKYHDDHPPPERETQS